MKKCIFTLIFSTLTIFTMSCDAETLAALTELIAGTPGCTIEQNANYNEDATMHVADSCATQIFGCTNSEALNYIEGATDDDDSCNLGITGCTDPNLANFNAQATISDSTACGDPTSTAGCTDGDACNYNPYATADCSNDIGTTDQTCCQAKFAAADTIITCYQDVNENGYYEDLQLLTADNCGCDDLNTFLTSEAYGWNDESNGEELAGCMDPSCPEYSASYNIDNYQCCITELVDSTFLETNEFSILGAYEMVMGSNCGGDQGGGSSGDTEKGLLFLGWDFVDNTGIYFTEMERTHTVIGFPAEPAYAYNAQSQADCEAEAQNGPWWCQNEMGGNWGEEFTPCHESYFEQECWNNPECNWRWAECTQKPNEIQEACHQAAGGGSINDQTTCESNPGCQWENGYDDWGNYNGQQPHCRFDCPGLSDTVCQFIPTECDWVLGGATGMQYCGYTPASEEEANGPAVCGSANETLGMSNSGDCWWEPNDWNEFAGPGICKCNTWHDWSVDWTTACESLPEGFALVSESEPDYCDWHYEASACDSYTDPASCQADYANHCMWDNWMWNDATQSQGICQQDPWFSEGDSCWDQSMQFASTCQAASECEWFDPGADAGNPDWAQDGLCENFDPCFYNDNDGMSGGYQFEPQCNQDPNCYWDPGMGGQGEGCFENSYEQWCDCRYEYTSQTCTYPMVWETFDNFGGQCMNPMDQWSCEYGDSGSGDGYIDCSMYEDVDRFQEWNAATSTCTEIKSEFDEGEWYLEGSSLCHTKEEMGPECSTINNFEECECAHECHWNGQGDPMQDPYTWEHNGSCDGGGPNEGGGRVSTHINPRINGTNSIYGNVNPKLLQILYHINSSASSPDDYVCEPFTQLPNGNIEMTSEDGCTVTLIRIEEDF